MQGCKTHDTVGVIADGLGQQIPRSGKMARQATMRYPTHWWTVDRVRATVMTTMTRQRVRFRMRLALTWRVDKMADKLVGQVMERRMQRGTTVPRMYQ